MKKSAQMMPPEKAQTPAPANAATIGPAAMIGPMPGIAKAPKPSNRTQTTDGCPNTSSRRSTVTGIVIVFVHIGRVLFISIIGNYADGIPMKTSFDQVIDHLGRSFKS